MFDLNNNNRSIFIDDIYWWYRNSYFFGLIKAKRYEALLFYPVPWALEKKITTFVYLCFSFTLIHFRKSNVLPSHSAVSVDSNILFIFIIKIKERVNSQENLISMHGVDFKTIQLVTTSMFIQHVFPYLNLHCVICTTTDYSRNNMK